MKKTYVSLLTALLLLVCTVFSLSACTGMGGGGDAGGSGEGGGGESVTIYEGQTYYDAGTKVVFLTDGRSSSQAASEALMSKIDRIAADGYKPVVGSVSDAPADCEIIVGYVPERDASKRAYELLARIESISPLQEARYLIYANSGTIAIAYDENYYSSIQVVDYAVDTFIGKYIGSGKIILINQGVVMSGTENLIDLQSVIDNEKLNDMWAEVQKKLSKETYLGLRGYYGMFRDNITDWFANLYDPGLGGFYATSSGRDEVNIFPDIESTYAVFQFIVESGMVDDLEGGIAANLPKIVKSQLIWYAKSLQDENGYFYITQFEKDYLDNEAMERRESDLVCAEKLLNLLGSAPTYTTPHNVVGDGVTADQYWATTGYDESLKPKVPVFVEIPEEDEETEGEGEGEDEGNVTASLSGSVVTAVSKAVAAADDTFTSIVNVNDYLGTHGKFNNYVKKINFKDDPITGMKQVMYDLAAIKAKSDAKGPFISEEGTPDDEKPGYEGKTYMNILFDNIAGMVNEKGLYGTEYMRDTSEQTVGCELVNAYAFDEILTFFNTQGVYFKNAAIAARGMLECLGGFEYTENIVTAYELWTILDKLNTNVAKYATAAEKEAYDAAYKAAVDELGNKACFGTYNRQSSFQKLSGGFGYIMDGCITTGTAGLVISTGEENEGSLGALSYVVTDLTKLICKNFNIDYVPTYTESDWLRFIDGMLELDPVIKYDRDLYKEPPITIFDFEDYPAKYFAVTTGGAEFKADLVDVNKFGADDMALYVNKLTAGSQVKVLCNDALIQDPAATMTVFNFDVMMTNMGAKSQMEISIMNASYTSHADKPILFLLQHRGTKNGDTITLMPYNNRKTEAQIDLKPKVGEWFNVRVELYEGTKETYRVKYYINNELVYTTNGKMGDNIVAGVTPLPMAEQINNATIALNSDLVGEFYFDNIYLHQTTQKLDDATVGIPAEYQAYLDSLKTPE